MSFFERLKAEASDEWRAYTEHAFTNGMADGSLPEAGFRHYLVQDYLFLIEFARAYALSFSPLRRRPRSRESVLEKGTLPLSMTSLTSLATSRPH